MTLVPLPAFADNYIWMLQHGPDAIVVDPGDAAPVFDALARSHLQLAAILVTHHHPDHTGATERRINPFLRSREADVLRAVSAHAGLSAHAAEAEVFGALRQ
ncbi:MAG: MBL fold metallo-hydrolase [Variovorax sp.]|nr:MAG: MBL fold metallo-hydrolase [Variovorax sp.]